LDRKITLLDFYNMFVSEIAKVVTLELIRFLEHPLSEKAVSPLASMFYSNYEYALTLLEERLR